MERKRVKRFKVVTGKQVLLFTEDDLKAFKMQLEIEKLMSENRELDVWTNA